MKKPSGREKTKLTSPEVRAAATLKRLSPPRSTRKQEEALLEEFYPGGGGTPYDGPVSYTHLTLPTKRIV